MPIYEFKCSKCDHFFEWLVIGDSDNMKSECPKCQSNEFERVPSSMNYSMGGSPAQKKETTSSQTRTCSSGSCSTYNIPGPVS